MTRFLLWLVFVLSFQAGSSQWLSSWIEIEPTLASASLRAGNVSLCDGSRAQLSIAVRGGAGPWRVEVLRDGTVFALVTLEPRPMQLFPAIFAKQDSERASASTTIDISVAGSYRLNRVCDLHYCNGTVTNASFDLSFNTPPTAAITPQHTLICATGSGGSMTPSAGSPPLPRLRLAGTPPLVITLTLVGDPTTTVAMRYNTEGEHDLPPLPSGGLWALTNVSDARGCPADTLSLPLSATVGVALMPEASLVRRSGEVCGDESADLEISLQQGAPPWSFTLQTPKGRVSIDNMTRSSYTFKAKDKGNYSLVSVRDARCSGRTPTGTGAAAVAVGVTHLAQVSGMLTPGNESTCEGTFRNLTGEVRGTPPFSVEIWRSGAFFRRVLVNGTKFSFAVDAPGVYTLRSVTDSRYCTAAGKGAVTLSQLPLPAVAAVHAVQCEGSPVRVAVRGTPPFRVSYGVTGERSEETVTARTCVPLPADASQRAKMLPAGEDASAWCAMELFGEARARPGLYTVASIQDGSCAARMLASVRVAAKPTMTLHAVVSDVCDGAAARLEVRLSGGEGAWQARVRYPDGQVKTIDAEKPSAAWDVSLEGDYTLVSGFRAECEAEVGASSSVSVRHFEAPKAVLSGDVIACAGQPAEIAVKVTGGQWPYLVGLLLNGRPFRKEPLLVTRPDGALSVAVTEQGTYTLQSVRDAR
eukprot:CAMPEP_0173408586 /NCGR_PEP_ID=MMETSP1356-20130122/70087_1 /TAXON_ID=77927 ORGANISM="Hemiselmis virescens, Strain PCC157" /NCGR_SAMPLE_ID=MMETSP1356 /ASSEMBLY_ACC=CAM_ASM_000847 /LENGTH=697 /DNA_ID=CAMNT_0014369921 /DNA_START=50 /DNA_END=2139 /DNA_ORIENTATION=+